MFALLHWDDSRVKRNYHAQLIYELEDIGFELNEEYGKMRFAWGIFCPMHMLDLYQGILEITPYS